MPLVVQTIPCNKTVLGVQEPRFPYQFSILLAVPMSKIRSCGSLASGNAHLLKVKGEPQSKEDRIKDLERQKEEWGYV